MEGVRPLVRRTAVGGDGGDVEAVCIRPEEECLILLIFLLVLVEGCKLRLREDGLQVFDPSLEIVPISMSCDFKGSPLV